MPDPRYIPEAALTRHFPDWKDLKPGEWSMFGKFMQFSLEEKPLEIGLYREPPGEYGGTYTLQVFAGDHMIFCKTVEPELLNSNEARIDFDNGQYVYYKTFATTARAAVDDFLAACHRIGINCDNAIPTSAVLRNSAEEDIDAWPKN